jgi:hypothetical protein
MIASVIKLFKELPKVPRKVNGGLKSPTGVCEEGWVGFHPDDDILRLSGPCDS